MTLPEFICRLRCCGMRQTVTVPVTREQVPHMAEVLSAAVLPGEVFALTVTGKQAHRMAAKLAAVAMTRRTRA